MRGCPLGDVAADKGRKEGGLRLVAVDEDEAAAAAGRTRQLIPPGTVAGND